MRPKGVESNQFAYHLEQLLKSKIIQKNGRDYSLTGTGLMLADRSSHKNIDLRKQPHIVTTICVMSGNKILLFEHKFQPYIGLKGFVQGRTHFNETVQESARRELFEKTGLENVDLVLRGTVYITAKKDGEVISKLLSHVFYGELTGQPKLESDNPKKGEAFWVEESEIKGGTMPGFREISNLLKNESGFFKEIEATI
ncbi:MAG TPA: NUDIX domain-containing protein [Candidatus Saccharimonadales bacterium]|nr:NUDIX domain-containing protein [Candidatus Saccharimonadales bacterium]